MSALVLGAYANPNSKSMRSKPTSSSSDFRTQFTETEPNDDCATANAVTVGDLVDATISPAYDQDYFELNVGAGDALYIHTILRDIYPSDLDDSTLSLFADDCSTLLDFDDDAYGLESCIIYEFADAGTYYAMAEGYSDVNLGDYQFHTQSTAFDHIGDTCDHATSISGGDFLYISSTIGMADDFGLPVADYGVGAPDAVFAFTLPPGASFNSHLQMTGADFVMYLSTECSDPEASELVFSDDDPKSIDYTNGTNDPQVLHLFIDGYEAGEQSGFILEGNNGGAGYVSNETLSWGEIKTMYR